MVTKTKKDPKATKVKNESNYTGENIKVLKGLEAVRMQYDMYVGSKDEAAIHLFKEGTDNSVDEYINGHATEIDVNLDQKKNIIRITDNGRGLPVDMHKTEKKPTIEVLFTNLHSGGKFDKDSFKVSSGKNGIGIKAINALSDYLKVISVRNGYMHHMEFSKGKVVKEFKKEKNTTGLKRGTIIEFRPDETIFEEYAKLDPEVIKQNLEVRTYSNAGLKITFTCGKDKVVYHNENGIVDYIDKINPKPISDTIYFDHTDKAGNFYEVALNYSNTTGETIKSFVNGINTSKGTHETGVKRALTTVFIDFIKNNNLLPKKLEKIEIKGDDVRQGLNCVINLRHTAAKYKGQTKDELSNPEVLGVMVKVSAESLNEFLAQNPDEGKKIANRIIAFAKGRTEANKIKDKIVSISSGSSGLSFSEKFNDCTLNDPALCEIFICEGQSASGNVNKEREPKTQAVYPLRGKILNTFDAKKSTILGNAELNELIKILFGTTDLKSIVVERDLRYHRVIILCDADNDGSHIQSLLLTFFYKYFPELITMGFVFIGMPPKWRCTIGGKFVYFKNDKELNEEIYKYTSKKYKTHNISLKQFVNKSNEFIELYDIIKVKYSVSNDVINAFLEDGEDALATIEEYGLHIENDERIYGIHDDVWHDVTLSDEFFDDLEKLYSIFNIDNVELEIKADNTIYEYSIIDAVQLVKKAFNYTLDYFKGLGEASSEELYETTIDPEKRYLIKVKVSDFEGSGNLIQALFGNKTALRKDFIQEYLSV